MMPSTAHKRWISLDEVGRLEMSKAPILKYLHVEKLAKFRDGT
jgi:hypothetical protein